MAALITLDDAPGVYCQETPWRHSDIQAAKPHWKKCGYCNEPFSVTASSKQQPVPPIGATQAPGTSALPAQPSGPMSFGTHFQPTVVGASHPLAHVSALQPQPQREATDDATPTHVSASPSLYSATRQGREQRASSLLSLERDKNALSRSGVPKPKKLPVMMVFLVAPYVKDVIGGFVTKTFETIRPAGSTGEVFLPLAERFANERELLRWLFENLRVKREHTGDKRPDVHDWRICTTAERGNKTKRASWERPTWDPDGPVSLSDYCSMVHEPDGKEKFPLRVGFVPGRNARTARRMLAVFAVSEVLVEEDEEPRPEAHPARARRQTPAVQSREHDDDGYVSQFAPKPTARPVISQPWSPIAPSLHGSPVSSLWSPIALRSNARPTVPLARHLLLEPPTLSSVGTESVPSRLESSALASGPDHTRPSTAASSVVEISNVALSGLALAPLGASNTYMGHQHGFSQPVTPPKQEPKQEVHDQRPSSEASGLFVCPANLEVETPAAARESPNPAAVTPGSGFVEGDHDADIIQVVGRKRKMLRPAQSEADGKPKPSKSKRTRKKTAKARMEEANARARQSMRIMARSALG